AAASKSTSRSERSFFVSASPLPSAWRRATTSTSPPGEPSRRMVPARFSTSTTKPADAGTLFLTSRESAREAGPSERAAPASAPKTGRIMGSSLLQYEEGLREVPLDSSREVPPRPPVGGPGVSPGARLRRPRAPRARPGAAGGRSPRGFGRGGGALPGP